MDDPAAPSSGTPASAPSGDSVLLVDDDPISLQILARTLDGEGLRLLIARGGAEALTVAVAERPALVLLDIVMPGMDGFEICRRLVSDPATRGSAVIFLTSLDEIKDKVHGLQLGAVDYITKPFDTAEVLARVRAHLTIHRLGQRLRLRNQELALENQRILESMGEGLYCLDNSGRVTYANPAAARLTGWPEERLVGRRVDELYVPRGHGADKTCLIAVTLATGVPCHSVEESFSTRSGEVPVECTCTPLGGADSSEGPDPIGKHGGAVLVFRDISERKRAERELRDAMAQVHRLKDRLQAEKLYLMDEIRSEQHFGEIVGDSPELRAVLDQVAQVAPTDTRVLIYGESGTGKEAIARAIHDLSPRRERALVKVNCAAIAPSLVESELFGHEKGAFTGALRARAGHFELADGGTIFLDEFGELSPDLQAKLLRVLEEQEIQRVGSERIIKVDVRVIAATNRDLKQMVEDGGFRGDLYYRMDVFRVTLPPLRERVSDIPLLVAEFLRRLAGRLGRRFDGVTQGSMDALMAYPWPGNIRELQNVIERAAILARGPVVSVDPSVLDVGGTVPKDDRHSGAGGDDPSSTGNLVTLAEAERAYIVKVLDATGGVVGGRDGAAGVLGLADSTLRSRMKKLGIELGAGRNGGGRA